MVLAIALIPVAILGLWGFMRVTATPLHPDPQRAPSVASSAPSPEWATAADHARQIVRKALAEQNLPGLSVAVGVGNDIVWAEGFGWADLDKRTPVAPDMTFRVGTMSTALSSAAVGLLLEDGRMKLDDLIQAYVPEFTRIYTSDTGTQSPVTLRQLMAHTAGVPNDGGDEGPLFSKHCERPIDALQFFSGYERLLRFEPGTQYRYSNYGWITVSAAVEAAAGEPFITFMQKKVFEPLGMRDTSAESTRAPAPKRATPYFPRFAGDPRYGLHPMRPLDFSCYAGSSVFLSTPSDLVRFGMAIISGALLQPATVQLLQASERLMSGEETGYGLGWDLENATLSGQPARWVGHDGMLLGGMVGSLMTFPERGLVVAVTSNISYTHAEAIALNIAQAFADERQSPARQSSL
jgi:CubicO group peptidase (beta-lactamase class C family)